MTRLVRGLLLFAAIVVLVTLGAALALFLARNAQWVVLRVPALRWSWNEPLYSLEYESPLSVVMVGAVAVGLVLGALLFIPSWLRRGVERRRERRFVRRLESELADLRNLPLTGPAPLEDLDEGAAATGAGAHAARTGRRPAAKASRRTGAGTTPDDDEAALMEALQDDGREAGP